MSIDIALLKQLYSHGNEGHVLSLMPQIIAELEAAQKWKAWSGGDRLKAYREQFPLMDAKWLDPACHEGCQSLVLKQRLAQSEAACAQMRKSLDSIAHYPGKHEAVDQTMREMAYAALSSDGKGWTSPEETDKLLAQLEARKEMLRKVEWEDARNGESAFGYCFFCDGRNDKGHATDCALAALLKS